jgi:hypothetical protein
MSEDQAILYIEHAAFKLGCERAYALLTDPDASGFDADKVTAFLKIILEPKKS